MKNVGFNESDCVIKPLQPSSAILQSSAFHRQPLMQGEGDVWLDDTKRRAGGPGGLEGRVPNWKTWIFGGLH